MAYEMTGTVKIIKDLMTFNSGFTKREFVITTEDDRFPQDVLFSCTKDRCALLDSLSIGERIQISFDIRGREYNGRHFVNLEAFRINRLDADQGAPVEEMPAADEPPIMDDGIPF